jgi:hypothetical protein
MKVRREMPTQARIAELFDYREDGKLIRRVSTASNARKGEIAGTLSGVGYWAIYVDGVRYWAHRLIFMLHHGRAPETIDHINGDPLDNRIENLRECSTSQNLMNRKRWRKREGEFKGASYRKDTGKWQAHIRIDGKKRNLGCFSTPEEASAAYLRAAKEHFGEFANDGTEA